jgi:hypothetical protein
VREGGREGEREREREREIAHSRKSSEWDALSLNRESRRALIEP